MMKSILFLIASLISVNSFGDMANLAGSYRCFLAGRPVGLLRLHVDQDPESLKIDHSQIAPAVKFPADSIACVNSSSEGADLENNYEFYACDENRISNSVTVGSENRVICLEAPEANRITVHSSYTNSGIVSWSNYKFTLNCEKLQP